MSTDNVVPIRQVPAKAGDDTLETYFDLAAAMAREHAERLLADPALGARLDNELWAGGPVLPSTAPELFFSTNKRDDRYEFEPASAGGWYCRGKSYDGPESPLGWGPTQKDALLHYLDQVDDEPGPATAAERELDEAIDAGLSE